VSIACLPGGISSRRDTSISPYCAGVSGSAWRSSRQSVRAYPCSPQYQTLGDPETVLLIDHDHTEVLVEVHRKVLKIA
jgi:hypothetical protein